MVERELVLKKCVKCGKEVELEPHQKLCYPCWRAEKKSNSAVKPEGVGKAVGQAKPVDSKAASLASFESEAVLLSKCVDAVLVKALETAGKVKEKGFAVSGDGVLEFVHSNANSLFISQGKNLRMQSYRDERS